MATAAKRSPALSKLHARILALSDKCADLRSKDLRNARARCQREHCERIWEQLEPKDRETIRRKVVAEDPYLDARKSSYLLESECVSVIDEELKQAGKVNKKCKHRGVKSKRATQNWKIALVCARMKTDFSSTPAQRRGRAPRASRAVPRSRLSPGTRDTSTRSPRLQLSPPGPVQPRVRESGLR
jgi:hypothetical protein